LTAPPGRRPSAGTSGRQNDHLITALHRCSTTEHRNDDTRLLFRTSRSHGLRPSPLRHVRLGQHRLFGAVMTDHEQALKAARDSLRNIVSIRDFLLAVPSRQSDCDRYARQGREQNPGSVGDTQRGRVMKKIPMLAALALAALLAGCASPQRFQSPAGAGNTTAAPCGSAQRPRRSIYPRTRRSGVWEIAH
jgi:hypothetical protein